MIYLDMTKLVSRDVKGGIPRVVSNLVAEMKSGFLDVQGIGFMVNSYHRLDSDVSHSTKQDEFSFTRACIKDLKDFFLTCVSKFPEGGVKDYLRGSRMARRVRHSLYKQKSNSISQNVITFQKGDLVFVMDIVTDRDQIEFLMKEQSNRNLKIVVLVHDLIPYFHKEYCVPSFLKEYEEYVRLLNLADHIITISETTKIEIEQFLKENLLDKPISVHTLPVTQFPECTHEDFKQDLIKHLPIFSFVSSIAPHKNHKRLINAYRELAKKNSLSAIPKLVLVAGSNWWRSEIQNELNLAHEDGLDILIFEGLPDCCLALVYEKSIFTTYLSEFEGFGLPILESLSFGTPVLCSDVGSMLEISIGGGVLTVNPQDSVAIENQLMELISSNKLILKLQEEIVSRRIKTWVEFGNEISSNLQRITT
jgi:glycosyltransferase involved in cell wall biosynthesis